MYMMKQKGPCVPSDQDAFASSLKGGEIQPVSVKVGDKVLLPEYGGTKGVLDDRIISYLERVTFLESTWTDHC